MSADKPQRGGARPGAGRPRTSTRTHRLAVYIAPEELAVIDAACEALECTRGELLVRAARMATAQPGDTID